MTFTGLITGLFVAALATLGWGLAFDQIGFVAWLPGGAAAAFFGVLVGIGCALPVWVSDEPNAGARGAGLAVIALVLGALTGLCGDVATTMLRAPGTIVDVASVLVFAQGRGAFEWVRAFIAAGAAAATCHRVIEGKRERGPR